MNSQQEQQINDALDAYHLNLQALPPDVGKADLDAQAVAERLVKEVPWLGAYALAAVCLQDHELTAPAAARMKGLVLDCLTAVEPAPDTLEGLEL